MSTSIKIGQILEGKLANYLVSASIARNVWTATPSKSQNQKAVIKVAPLYRLNNERNVLQHFRGKPHIRQLLDVTEDPPSMVLKHLDDNLLSVSSSKALEGMDVKFVAKRVLEALQALHEDGYTHTGNPDAEKKFRDKINRSIDIKPDNILVNLSKGPLRFSDVELADLGDVCRIAPEEYLRIGESGPHMGAAIFRSPEAMLHLRWGPSTDIWSFGATLISLIWGLHYHIFKPDPKHAGFDDDDFLIHILIRQLATFGPVPASYATLIADDDDSRWDVLGNAIQFIQEYNMIKPFALAKDKCLTEEDKELFLKVMKIDPRDRPTAGELLRDQWFEGVP